MASEPLLRAARAAGITAVVALVLGGGAFGAATSRPRMATDAQTCGPAGAELQELARTLRSRGAALDRRVASVETREKDLKSAEEALVARIAELEALRKSIEEASEGLDEQETVRRDGLVKMFEAMRAKNSGAVMSEVESELAVEVLDRMNRRKAGKLLAAMEPTKAARLAEEMADPIAVEAP